jgi:hypothetical protein
MVWSTLQTLTTTKSSSWELAVTNLFKIGLVQSEKSRW